MKTCLKCGYQNSDEAKFCSNCGAEIAVKSSGLVTSIKKHKTAVILLSIVGVLAICLCGVFGLFSLASYGANQSPVTLPPTIVIQTIVAQIKETQTVSTLNVASQEPTSTMEPKPTKTKALGTSRDNPAPFGSEAATDGMVIRITDVTRPADSIVYQANGFNPSPDPGNEYIKVDVGVRCDRTSDEKCMLNPFAFKLLDSSGILHEMEFILMPCQFEVMPEFFSGATVQGCLIYEINQNASGLILEYDDLFLPPVYLDVPD